MKAVSLSWNLANKTVGKQLILTISWSLALIINIFYKFTFWNKRSRFCLFPIDVWLTHKKWAKLISDADTSWSVLLRTASYFELSFQISVDTNFYENHIGFCQFVLSFRLDLTKQFWLTNEILVYLNFGILLEFVLTKLTSHFAASVNIFIARRLVLGKRFEFCCFDK